MGYWLEYCMHVTLIETKGQRYYLKMKAFYGNTSGAWNEWTPRHAEVGLYGRHSSKCVSELCWGKIQTVKIFCLGQGKYHWWEQNGSQDWLFFGSLNVTNISMSYIMRRRGELNSLTVQDDSFPPCYTVPLWTWLTACPVCSSVWDKQEEQALQMIVPQWVPSSNLKLQQRGQPQDLRLTWDGVFFFPSFLSI